MEMSEVCALEVDIEYSGGALLEIETRLEVGELELEREREDLNPESSNDGAVPSDILEGFEYLDEQLNLAEGMNDLQEPKGDGEWIIRWYIVLTNTTICAISLRYGLVKLCWIFFPIKMELMRTTVVAFVQDIKPFMSLHETSAFKISSPFLPGMMNFQR